MNKIVRVNSGKALHFKHSEMGIICGGSTPSNKKRIDHPIRVKPNYENITCKKCKAEYKKIFFNQTHEFEEKKDEELSLKEHCEKYGRTTTISK